MSAMPSLLLWLLCSSPLMKVSKAAGIPKDALPLCPV